uniref:Uncharacterized protein n=1 Tax=Mycena chlorophos TaxID=658473 RepID=A0ABQ0L7H6_MYCCL|nr:predicted protein [Mycena chlorophos]
MNCSSRIQDHAILSLVRRLLLPTSTLALYWSLLHAGLNGLQDDASSMMSRRSGYPHTWAVPGDLVVVSMDGELKSAYVEYLQSQGHKLNSEEAIAQRLLEKRRVEPLRRPSVVLDYVADDPNSRVVGFLTKTDLLATPDVTYPPYLHITVPFGTTDGALTVQPPMTAIKGLLALPVIRHMRHLRKLKRAKAWSHTTQLSYGELERARAIVREKTAHLQKNLSRMRHEANVWGRRRQASFEKHGVYPPWPARGGLVANRDLISDEFPRRIRSRPPIQRFDLPVYYGSKRQNISSPKMRKLPKMKLAMNNDIRWFLRRRFEFLPLESASRFLSSAWPGTLPEPRFVLPQPAPPVPTSRIRMLRRLYKAGTGLVFRRRAP